MRGEHVRKARYVPPSLFRAFARGVSVLVDAKTRAALRTLPVFLDYLKTEQSFENTRTNEWLQRAGITVPRAEDYLPRVLDFYFTAPQRRGSDARKKTRDAHA